MMVPFEKTIKTTNVIQQPLENIVKVRVEVPIRIKVDKITTKTAGKVVEVRKSTIIIEVAVPVDRTIEQAIPPTRKPKKSHRSLISPKKLSRSRFRKLSSIRSRSTFPRL